MKEIELKEVLQNKVELQIRVLDLNETLHELDSAKSKIETDFKRKEYEMNKSSILQKKLSQALIISKILK